MRIVALRVLLHSLVCKEESTDMRKSILPVGGKFYGAYHFIYGYFARRTGKNACLL